MEIDLKKDELSIVKNTLDRHLQHVDYFVFGSRAKNTAKHYSDLDIALVGREPISLKILSALEEDFAESDLPFMVDLVDWQRISSEFQDKIKSEWKKI